MSEKVIVKLPKYTDDSYELVIGTKLDIGQEIKSLNLNNHYAVITDDKVYKLYGSFLKQVLDEAGLYYHFIVFKNGEKSKNLKTFSYISEELLRLGYDRKSVIIAFGGGVVGDMAGYAAGTFMRGIPFIQIPTTLLAQVDSSIGGKVAVDLKYGKNSTGLFYQPKKVIIDTDFLNTLTDEEFSNGMFEIIKHAVIRSRAYFKFLEDNTEKIKDRSHHILRRMISESCKIKADVVMNDETENNLRRILNFGHTCGHAVETLSHYRIKHGFAVGEGMKRAVKIAVSLKMLNSEDKDKINFLLNQWGASEHKFPLKPFMKIIANDKKNIKSGENMGLQIPLVLPTEIGHVQIRKFSADELQTLLKSIDL